MMGQARVRSAGHNISDFQLTFKAKTTVDNVEEFTGTFAIDDVELLVTDYCPFHPSDAEPPIGKRKGHRVLRYFVFVTLHSV